MSHSPLATYQPKITDFGLAKLVEGGNTADSNRTRTGMVLGTPQYMAPEQAAGQNRTVGPAADIYALGTMLYELLTGRPPFAGASVTEILQRIQNEEPVAPRQLRRTVPRDLEAICLNCLRKEPERRYASAEALAEDLRRFQNGQTIRARRVGRGQRLARWCRRYPALSMAYGLTTCAVAALVALGLYVARGQADLNLDPIRTKLEQEAAQRQEWLESARRALAEGKEVTLLDGAGSPCWGEWPLGKSKYVNPIAEQNIFRYGVSDAYGDSNACMVELLPPGPRSSYRFSAEVRQDASEPAGQAGIYFGHSQHEVGGAVEHCFATLTFNDRVAPQIQNQGLVPHGGRTRFYLRRYRPPHSWPIVECGPGLHYEVAPGINTPDYAWRQLVVDVAPSEIRSTWDGQAVGVFDQTALQKRFLRLNTPQAKDYAPDLRPALGPQGGLGLYVSFGSASFRNLRVVLYE